MHGKCKTKYNNMELEDLYLEDYNEEIGRMVTKCDGNFRALLFTLEDLFRLIKKDANVAQQVHKITDNVAQLQNEFHRYTKYYNEKPNPPQQKGLNYLD